MAMQDQHPAALHFKLSPGSEVDDLPPNPNNEVDNETRDPTVKWVAAQDTAQQMKDATNDDNPHEK